MPVLLAFLDAARQRSIHFSDHDSTICTYSDFRSLRPSFVKDKYNVARQSSGHCRSFCICLLQLKLPPTNPPTMGARERGKAKGRAARKNAKQSPWASGSQTPQNGEELVSTVWVPLD
jgi:hypothetical protein